MAGDRDRRTARARRAVRRAQGLMRDAARELAAAAEPPDLIAELELEAGDEQGLEQALELVRSAHARHGRLELTITRAVPAPPHSTREGAKETAA